MSSSNRAAVRPVVIASANGHQYRNGGPQSCVERAFTLMTAGTDALEAVVAGVTIVELDPAERSVGFGGLPNAEGVVQLDASVMHGRLGRAAGVAVLEGVPTAAAVAHRLMETMPHHLLAGADAQRFAAAHGFAVHHDLNTDHSRALWREWKRRLEARGSLDGDARIAAGYDVGLEMSLDGSIDPNHLWGTINCNALSPAGDLVGATTTSGLAWKLPGRVGDSPILGAGLYVRQAVGAAGSTGRGESNLYNLSAYSIVDRMRRGAHPKDAAMAALEEVRATAPAGLRNRRGEPNFNVKFYVLNARGEFAGAALYGGDHVQYAVCTEHGGELRPCDALLEGPML